MRTATLAVAVALVLATGCSTLTTRVLPLETTYPVSASDRWVDDRGRIVGPEESESMRSFAFERRVEGVFGQQVALNLDLKSGLDAEVAAVQGEAVTRLAVRTIQADPGNYGTRLQWDVAGWSLVGAGALCFAGAAVSQENEAELVATGGLVTLLGVGIFGLVRLLSDEEPPAWTLMISGDVVRRRAPAVAAPVAPARPAAPSEPQ